MSEEYVCPDCSLEWSEAQLSGEDVSLPRKDVAGRCPRCSAVGVSGGRDDDAEEYQEER